MENTNQEVILNNKIGNLETYFASFRENIIGINQEFQSPFGLRQIIYTNWTAS